MYHAGLVPEKTSDPAGAFDLWQRDGAAILTVEDLSGEGLLRGIEQMFGAHLLGHQGLSRVAANENIGGDTYFDPETRTVHANTVEQLGLHVDAYMAFGPYYPDLNALLCASQAPSGGESFLVDGRAMVEAIAADPAEQALAAFVRETPIEQSRPAGAGPQGTRPGLPHRRPIASRTSRDHFSVIFHEHQRLLDEQPHDPAEQALLARWTACVRREGEHAPRFRLEPGDLLCLDNYRVFHGREPYDGTSRLLHKLWAWTDLSFGLPAADTLVAAGRNITSREVSR